MGPPPDTILGIPPPPLPAFLQRAPVVNNTSTCSVLCDWTAGPGVEYVELPRHGTEQSCTVHCALCARTVEKLIDFLNCVRLQGFGALFSKLRTDLTFRSHCAFLVNGNCFLARSSQEKIHCIFHVYVHTHARAHTHKHTHMHCQNLKSGNDADQLSVSLFMLLSYCQKYPAVWGIENFMVSLQIILDTDWAMMSVPSHHKHKNVNGFCCPLLCRRENSKKLRNLLHTFASTIASHSC